MHIYQVGGAVRDRLLGLSPHEIDWVVTGATVDDMLARGFRRLDPAIPVFAHPDSGDEYALARREHKQAHGHKGFTFEYDPDVTLEEDLRRRDLTVNAMAEDDRGRIIDPYGGREDLAARRLRHVGPAFVEDPLRVLRLARFSAQLAGFGFAVASETANLARQMSADADLLTLTPARCWRELSRALVCDRPGPYLAHLHRFGTLARLMPWLAWNEHPVAGMNPPDAALDAASLLTQDAGVRLTAACLSAARHGASGRVPDDWPLPRPIRTLVRQCLEHPLPDRMTPEAVLGWLERMDGWRREEQLQRAALAWRGAAPHDAPRVESLVQAAAATRKVRPPSGSTDPRRAVRDRRLAIIAGMPATGGGE